MTSSLPEKVLCRRANKYKGDDDYVVSIPKIGDVFAVDFSSSEDKTNDEDNNENNEKNNNLFSGIVVYIEDLSSIIVNYKNIEKQKSLTKEEKKTKMTKLFVNVNYQLYFPKDNSLLDMKLIDYILNEPIHILKYIKKDVLITEFKIELLKTLKIYTDKDIDNYNKLYDINKIKQENIINIDNYNKLYDINKIKQKNDNIIKNIDSFINPIDISNLNSQMGIINQPFDISFSKVEELKYVLNATKILLNGSFALSYLGMEEKEKDFVKEHDDTIKKNALPTAEQTDIKASINGLISDSTAISSNTTEVNYPIDVSFDDSPTGKINIRDLSSNTLSSITLPFKSISNFTDITKDKFIKEQKIFRYLDIKKDGQINPNITSKIKTLYSKSDTLYSNEKNDYKEKYKKDMNFHNIKEQLSKNNNNFITSKLWIQPLDNIVSKYGKIEKQVVAQESGFGPKWYINMDKYFLNVATDVIDKAGRINIDTIDDSMVYFTKDSKITLDSSFLSLFGFENTSITSTRESNGT